MIDFGPHPHCRAASQNQVIQSYSWYWIFRKWCHDSTTALSHLKTCRYHNTITNLVICEESSYLVDMSVFSAIFLSVLLQFQAFYLKNHKNIQILFILQQWAYTRRPRSLKRRKMRYSKKWNETKKVRLRRRERGCLNRYDWKYVNLDANNRFWSQRFLIRYFNRITIFFFLCQVAYMNIFSSYWSFYCLTS